MHELALFTGAGGGLLASHLLGFTTVCAVEKDPFAQSILIQRQNDRILRPFPIWDDVCTFDGGPWRGRVDLVSGGFPCQAFSSAAAGRNVARDLWPEMFRVVREVEPALVFAENVSRKAINQAANDLLRLGYKAKALPLAAADLGGDHVRKRYWLLAYTDDQGELLRSLDGEKMALVQGVHEGLWSADPGIPRVADGLANRMDRFRASGNGQVAAVAALAFLLLAQAASGRGREAASRS